MKKILSFTFVAALLLTLVSLPGAARVSAQAGLVSSIFSRMQRNQQSLKGVILYIPGLGGSRNSFVRLEWTSPQHETLAVAKGNYRFYRPRLNTVIEGPTRSVAGGKNNDVLELMSMSATQFRTKFGEFQDVRDETLGGGVWTQHFRVTPKGAASYNYIEVWVDKEGLPVQTKMVEKNNDATTVRLTNIQKNQTISPGEFELKLDSSVKRVKG